MESWNGGEPFRESFPELYQLERRKACTVKERIHEAGLNWDWRSPLTTDEQIRSFHSLLNAIGGFRPTPGIDFWKCALTDDGNYHVGAIRAKLDRTGK